MPASKIYRRVSGFYDAAMPRVSVIIPTFNGGALFGEVLRGLKRQVLPGEIELLVIDSGSRDQTLTLAREAGATVIQIPNHEFDHGLTRNLAIEKSSGDLIVLMTQDAVPADEHLIASLTSAFEDPAVAGSFARQTPRPEHDVLVARGVRNWVAGQAERRVSQITDRAAFEGLAPMDRYLFCVFDNVCSAMRRSVWREIPLRQSLFGEDLDWSKRALEAGWKIVYEPAAAVIHSHSRSARYEYRRTYMGHRAFFRLFGLQTIAHAKYIPRCFIHATLSDMAYAWVHQKGLPRKLALMAKVPFHVHGSVMGAYRGARDERLNRGVRQVGV